MGIVDCLSEDKGIVGYLYDTLYALVKAHVDDTVTVLTRPRKNNGTNMPEQYVYIEIFELPVNKHSMNPCSFAQDLTVAVDILLPYNQDELSRRLVRVIQAIFYAQLEYAMIVKSAKSNTSDTPLGSLNSIIIDVSTILQRGVING